MSPQQWWKTDSGLLLLTFSGELGTSFVYVCVEISGSEYVEKFRCVLMSIVRILAIFVRFVERNCLHIC